jgi:hypothetical protein
MRAWPVIEAQLLFIAKLLFKKKAHPNGWAFFLDNGYDLLLSHMGSYVGVGRRTGAEGNANIVCIGSERQAPMRAWPVITASL